MVTVLYVCSFLADPTVTQYDRLLASIMSSDCPSVMLCIMALRVGVEGKSCSVVFLADNFLLTSYRHWTTVTRYCTASPTGYTVAFSLS